MATSVPLSHDITSQALLIPDPRPVYRFDPLKDARWNTFLQHHPRSSIFHTVEWLTALRRTYGYAPMAITTCPPEADLGNAAVFCRVESWLTGCRLVSLPFSDHSDILANTASDLTAFVAALREQLRQGQLRYIELRPWHAPDKNLLDADATYEYYLHHIDLTPDLNTLFRNCHKSSTQRKIRRAERERLVYREGRSETLLDQFYQLLVLTRRRQKALPQPKKWFRNLMDAFGERLKIRVAYRNEQPIASIITLRHKDALVYKYGCSDANFHRLGGVQMLFWKSIEEAKREGLRLFDLGRSEPGNAGLVNFKEHWGASRSTLTYLRLLKSDTRKGAFVSAGADWKQRVANNLLPHVPNRMVRSAGEWLYRHVG